MRVCPQPCSHAVIWRCSGGVQCLLWECRQPKSSVTSRCSCADEDTLVRVSRDKLPGDALALSLQKVWEVIRDQKDLNLPAHKVQLRGVSGQSCLILLRT